MEQNGDATTMRLQTELARVAGLVHAELVRAGTAVPRPMPEAWRITDALTLLDDSAQQLDPRTSAILEAGIVVQQTYESMTGPREQKIAALRGFAHANRNLIAANEAARAYFETITNVGGRIAINEEDRTAVNELAALEAQLDAPAQLAAKADAADALADQLERRRPTSIRAEHYSAKGSGPFSHFLWALAQPLAPADKHDEYLEWFAQWLPVTRESLKAPRLTLAEIAELADETYHHSKRTPDDLEDAIERVRQRILRFQAGCIAAASP
jgi:hypothetical protein